jgi:hypothetical protein
MGHCQLLMIGDPEPCTHSARNPLHSHSPLTMWTGHEVTILIVFDRGAVFDLAPNASPVHLTEAIEDLCAVWATYFFNPFHTSSQQVTPIATRQTPLSVV